jgi:integrase
MKGHVEKRRGRYRVVVELDPIYDDETGARLRRKKGLGMYRTKAEADEVLRDALDAARRGWRGPARITLARYLREDWLPGVDMERAPTTAALYRVLMETYVIPRIGGTRIDGLTPGDLTALYAELLKEGKRGKKPLAPKTVRHVHTTLRKALADAVEARVISWNPAEAAKAPKVTRTEQPAAWSAEDVRRFLAHVSGERLEPLWLLAASTGMRRGELLGLRWVDADLERGSATIAQTRVAFGKVKITKEPKTVRSRRRIPLTPRVVGALRVHKKHLTEERLAAGAAYADGGLVFPDELGGSLDPASISAAFSREVGRAELPRITLHGLRHSFATVALEAGVDVLYVSELLGHSSPAITQAVYQHVRPERLEAAVETIAAAIE